MRIMMMLRSSKKLCLRPSNRKRACCFDKTTASIRPVLLCFQHYLFHLVAFVTQLAGKAFLADDMRRADHDKNRLFAFQVFLHLASHSHVAIIEKFFLESF